MGKSDITEVPGTNCYRKHLLSGLDQGGWESYLSCLWGLPPQDPVHTHAFVAFTVLTFQHRGQEHKASTRDSFLGQEQEKNYKSWIDKYKQ